MVRETAVELVEDIVRLVAEYFLGEKVCHTVGKVEGNVEIAPVCAELVHKRKIVRVNVLLEHMAAFFGYRGRPALLYPLLDLAEAAVKTYRKGVLAGNLHSVVFGRVVGSGDLD